ncbi:hypothetical protein [Kitasatospora sp. NPDC091207]|uniref:hypothetical protein n=1 Tax=Kitasatospora sp. NPDC091207 TaxID=3364083 RepID=UPI00381296BA
MGIQDKIKNSAAEPDENTLSTQDTSKSEALAARAAEAAGKVRGAGSDVAERAAKAAGQDVPKA